MSDEINLRVPGPTPLPQEVRQALSRQMMNHRGPAFAAIMRDVHRDLRYFFATENPILTYPAAGTGGLEASLVNLFSPGDEVVAAVIGAFGQRYADMAAAFGLTAHRVEYPWGLAARAEDIARALAEHPSAKALLVTQNETSTGVLNPIEEIARAARAVRPDLLILVDGISGLGASPLLVDGWDLDVVVTGSQKSWMVPPGMAMLSVGPRAWDAIATARLPRYYWDFTKARQSFDTQNPPYTPAVSLYYALQTSLRMMRDEGREGVWARHAAIAERTRAGVQRLGLDLLADPAHYSASVTAIRIPEGVEAKEVIRTAREDHNVVFAGGQGALAGKIIRIGHLGWVTDEQIDEAIAALGTALQAHGWRSSSDKLTV